MEISDAPPVGAQTTQVSQIWQDRFLRIRFLPTNVTVEDARLCVAIGERLAGATRLPLLVDFRLVRSIAANARVYFASEEASKVLIATAIVVSSPVSRAIGNFFLGFNRPPVPTRLFGNTEDAARWLDDVFAVSTRKTA